MRASSTTRPRFALRWHGSSWQTFDPFTEHPDQTPELVVGGLIVYDYGSDDGSLPSLTRTADFFGKPNEGPEKVANIQTQLGRRPIVAVGNSGGDREMLEWAAGGEGPRIAVLIDHDDDEREYAYESRAVSFEEEKPISEVAANQGWTVVSMANDWETVFEED